MVGVLSFTLWQGSVCTNILTGISTGIIPQLKRQTYSNRPELFKKCKLEALKTRTNREVEDLLRWLE